jgi:hypothetical protein
MQEGKTALIKKDGAEMLIAIVLDKPLAEAQALVDDPDAFMLAITKIIQNKHAHPVIAQCSTLMCVTTCPLQSVPRDHQKAKAAALERRTVHSLKRNFNKNLPSTWDTHG